MILQGAVVEGTYVIDIEPRRDERGFFARAFDSEIFSAHGMEGAVAQCNLSHSDRRGTLRGMHWQAAPHAEARLVRCVRGSIYDVIVDVRPGSPTYLRWSGVELSAANARAVYAPPGTAHGFLTLEDDTDVLYQVSVPYAPESERGMRWDDPLVGVAWPFVPTIITDKDRSWADLVKEAQWTQC